MFNNINDLLDLFPHYEDASNGEYHTPCPFCNKGASTTYKSKKFYGTDRLIWYADGKGVYCRQEEKYYPIDKVAEFFDGRIAPDFDMLIEGSVEFRTEAPVLASPRYVDQCHAQVDRSYWYANGWSDQTIDRFKLGKGSLYPFSTKAQRHLIPMQCQLEGEEPLSGYSFEGRLVDKEVNEPRNIKTKGLTKGYFWYVEDDPDNKTIAVAEGPKDAITLWQNGYKNFAAIFGSGGFTSGIADFLKSKGYTRILVFGDNDEAGDKFDRNVTRMFFPIKVMVLEWPEGTPDKYDVTDSFIEGSLTRLLKDNFTGHRSKGFIPDYTVIDPEYVPTSPDEGTMSRDDIREDMPVVIQDFLDNYKDRKKFYGRGVVKLLAAPPGVGKSYIMVKAAQDRARKVLEERNHNLDLLQERIEEVQEFLHDPDLEESERVGYVSVLEKLKSKKLRVNRIVYAGPFVAGWHDIQNQPIFDPLLWFNYEARNEENCQNLDAVSAIAAKGYNSRAFCETSCPMKEWCMESGYLSQDEKRQQYPITYVRHQHIEGGVMQGSNLLFIDEEPFHVFEKDMSISSSDIRPVYEADWEDFVEPDQVSLINELVGGLKAALEGTEEDLSGYEVLSEIDKRCGNRLSEILQAIDPDVLDAYQPVSGFVVKDVKDVKRLPQRCFTDIYEALASEIKYYEAGQKRYNTRIGIRRKHFHIFRVDKLVRPASHPIIVADATAMAPDLYGLLFDREVETYKPVVWSDKAHTTVYFGSDFTRTSIRQQIGPAVTLMNKYVEDTIVHDIFGEPFDLSTIPVDENMYDSAILNQAMTLMKEIESKHSSLLVITYKPIRLLMERKVQQAYPEMKVRFAHYGSLRGTNIYKDIEAVLLIGCHRIPYDHLYRRAQAWARMAGYVNPLDDTVVMKTAPYHGRPEGYTYLGFEDAFENQFVDLVEVGEIQQALDRIRIFTSDTDKYAYLALSRPAAQWVSEIRGVYQYTNFLNNTKNQEMTTYIADYWAENGKSPTYKLLVDKFRVSRRDVKTALEEVRQNRQEQVLSLI